MKRLITNSDLDLVGRHLTDLFDALSRIVYVDDINTHESVFASEGFDIDYSEYTDEDLASLDRQEIHEIDDLYTIYRICNINSKLLSAKQKRELQKMYHLDPSDLSSRTWRYYLDDTDVAKILDMLKEHNRVSGPRLSRDPNKNFAERHDLDITPSDYAHILHSLTLDECRVITPYLTVNHDLNDLGNNLIVFNVEKEFELKSGEKIGHFKVYIKIDFTRTGGSDNPIALISFHE